MLQSLLLFCLNTFICLSTNGSFSDAKTSEPPHQTYFVSVADSVRLEVLDWGGEGPPLVFLAGLSMTAHIFSDFAPKFTDHYHVYGLTRRGFGQSSVPKTGYDIDTRAQDIKVMLDSLHIDKGILVGHSLAGDELTRFAGRYPNRVSRVVYLDAAYDNVEGMKLLKDPPIPPRPTTKDSASLAAYRHYKQALYGYAAPLEEWQQTSQLAKDGRYLGDKTPAFVYGAITSQFIHPDYRHVQCPALAIYSKPVSLQKMVPFLNRLNASDLRRVKRGFLVFQQRFRIESTRFQQEVRRGRVKTLENAAHALFLERPAEVERLMRDFLN